MSTTKTTSATATNFATIHALSPPSISNASYGPAQLLCDWTISASGCRDEEFTRATLLTSAIVHALVGVFGIFVLRLHNGGFRRTIVTDLLSKTGWTINAKRPLDCFVLFGISACFFRVLSVVLLLLDPPQVPIWLRIVIEQLYWASYIIAVLPYALGVLNSIPVTECEGVFAVYRPEPGNDGVSQPIYLFYPTMRQKTQFFVFGSIYPIIFGVGCGVTSGVLNERAFYSASHTLHIIQNVGLALLYFFISSYTFYYGFKYAAILTHSNRSIMNETRTVALGFGLFAVEWKATSRHLIIMWQITAYGGGVAFFMAGLVTCLWAWNKEAILSAKDVRGTRAIEALWMCGTASTFFVKMCIIAIHPYLTANLEPQQLLHDAPLRSESYDLSEYHISNVNSLLEHSAALDHSPEATVADRTVYTCYSASHPGLSKDVAPASSKGTDVHGETGGRRKVSVEEGYNPATNSSSGDSITTIGPSRVSLDPAQHASELQAILMRYQSALRQIQWLQILHHQERQPRNKREQFEDLQKRMLEIKLQVHRAQVLFQDYQQSQTQVQTGNTLGLIGSMRDHCLHNDLLALQHQVKSSLQEFSILATSHNSSLQMP